MKKILATTTEVAEAVVVVVGCEEEESVFTGLLLPQLDRLQLSINNQTQTPVVGLTWILEYLLLSKSSSKDALLLQPQQLNPLVRNRLLKHQTTSTTVTSSSPAPPPPPYISLLTSGFTCHACANPLLIHIDKCTPYTTPRFTSIHHLPSTYWTELIDCWSCHTEDYLSKFTLDSSKSNITRDGRVLPRNSSTVLVGEEVVMVHADAIDFVNGVRGVGGSSDDETDGGNNRVRLKFCRVKVSPPHIHTHPLKEE